MSALSLAEIDADTLGEAADWLVLFQSGDASAEDAARLAHWRQLSPAHEMAWRRAEDVLTTFRQVPAQLGHGTLHRVSRVSRRKALRHLPMLAFASPAARFTWRYLPWREWSADLRTATGEQRGLDLADRTRPVLNTDTAVDVRFTATERRLTLLAGEIRITTAHDPAPTPHPFLVVTAQGRLQALGTRFAVSRLGAVTRVVVAEGAVEIQPADASRAAVV